MLLGLDFHSGHLLLGVPFILLVTELSPVMEIPPAASSPLGLFGFDCPC